MLPFHRSGVIDLFELNPLSDYNLSAAAQLASFPFCECDRLQRRSPYRLIRAEPVTVPEGTEYCFTINTVPCLEDNKCCSMDYNKLEFNSSE